MASKSTQKIYTGKTDKMFSKLIKEAPLLKDFNILTGKHKPDAKPKNVMVKTILSREKRDETNREAQGENEHGHTSACGLP